jgi:hypothetical protein
VRIKEAFKICIFGGRAECKVFDIFEIQHFLYAPDTDIFNFPEEFSSVTAVWINETS